MWKNPRAKWQYCELLYHDYSIEVIRAVDTIVEDYEDKLKKKKDQSCPDDDDDDDEWLLKPLASYLLPLWVQEILDSGVSRFDIHIHIHVDIKVAKLSGGLGW